MHFNCLILTEDQETDIEIIAARALEPFDESITVGYYDRDCICTLNRRFREMLKANPAKTCPSCKGNGSYKSNYNPKSKWDYYSIGGRWHGLLGKNVSTVKELLAFKDTASNIFALLEPDGSWHQGQSFYDSSEEDQEQWPAKVQDVLTRNQTCRAILCDLHI